MNTNFIKRFNITNSFAVAIIATSTLLSGCYPMTDNKNLNDKVEVPKPNKDWNISSSHCPPFDTNELKACTMQFDPVCVKEQDAQGNINYRTAGNACSACNSPEAISYTPGECSRQPV